MKCEITATVESSNCLIKQDFHNLLIKTVASFAKTIYLKAQSYTLLIIFND